LAWVGDRLFPRFAAAAWQGRIRSAGESDIFPNPI